MSHGNKIEIDFKKVDQMLIAGYTGFEVAAELGIHEDTLYNRVKEQFGVKFSAYSAALHSKGDGMIKAVRFKKAMEGNVPILLYLSEYRLKEKRAEKLYEASLKLEAGETATQLQIDQNNAVVETFKTLLSEIKQQPAKEQNASQSE